MVSKSNDEEDNEDYNGKEEGENVGTTCCCIQSITLDDSIVKMTLLPLLLLPSMVVDAVSEEEERNKCVATPELTAVEKSPSDVKNLIVDIHERRVLELDRN